MFTHRLILAPLAFAAIGLVSSAAWADDTSSVKTTTSNSEGYGFVFRDDPLAAEGLDGTAPRIALVIHASRATLIRPRTAFVVEMLKSVEKL